MRSKNILYIFLLIGSSLELHSFPGYRYFHTAFVGVCSFPSIFTWFWGPTKQEIRDIEKKQYIEEIKQEVENCKTNLAKNSLTIVLIEQKMDTVNLHLTNILNELITHNGIIKNELHDLEIDSQNHFNTIQNSFAQTEERVKKSFEDFNAILANLVEDSRSNVTTALFKKLEECSEKKNNFFSSAHTELDDLDSKTKKEEESLDDLN